MRANTLEAREYCVPILSISTPEMGEMTTLGKAVADISIPTWKELKPASETAGRQVRAQERGTQHDMMKETMMRTTRHDKATVEEVEGESALRRGAVEPIMTSAK
jgi:hypothetical protein